jgi:hypothetical protein
MLKAFSALFLIVVALNALTVASFEPNYVPSLGAYSIFQHLAVFFLLGTACWTVMSRPKDAVGFTLYATVLTGGVYVYRYAILDELVTFAIALGLFFSKKEVERKSSPDAFYMLLVYMAFMSLIGLVSFSEVRALRFVFIAIVVLYISYHFATHKSQVADLQLFRVRMVYVLVCYEVGYIINAVIVIQSQTLETMLGIGGAGAGYQSLIFIFTLPSCFIVLGSASSLAEKCAALFGVVLALVISASADSRLAYLSFVVSLLAVAPKMSKSSLASLVVTSIGAMALAGWYFFDNAMMGWTLLSDIFAQDLGDSVTVNYYGTIAEKASGDQGRVLLILNGIYYFATHSSLFIFSGIGAYGYVYEAYPVYQDFLQQLGIIDSVVSTSAFGTPPRPPSAASYLVDYGLVFIVLLSIVYINFIKSSLKRGRHALELLAYFINLTIFTLVSEQLDTVATFMLLHPLFIAYFNAKLKGDFA